MTPGDPRGGRVASAHEVARPAAFVEEAVRHGPDHLWHLAFEAGEGRDGRLVLPLFSRGEVELGHYEAIFDFSSVTQPVADGAVLGVRWHPARHGWLVPSGEGEVRVHPSGPAGRCELSLTARYRPPGGPAGRLADRVAGRRLAALAADSFLDRLAEVLEETPVTHSRNRETA